MIRSWLNKNVRSLAASFTMAMIVMYFAFLTVQGDRGIFAMLRKQSEIRAAEQSLADLRAGRSALEARVKHMRPNSIDPDLLDEQIRLQLNLVKSDDLVVLTSPQSDAAVLQRNKNRP